MVMLLTQIYHIISCRYVRLRNFQFFRNTLIQNRSDFKYYSKKSSKDPKKEEAIQGMTMPGFVHPQTKNEEGYFTQQAKQQIEELKRRGEKPTTEDKKE